MTTNPQFDAIFDFDGVLADSAPLIVEILERLLCRELGMTLTTGQLRTAVGPPFHQAVADLCSSTNTSPDATCIETIVESFRSEYAARVADETPMFTGVQEMLATMHGNFRMTICSSKPRPLIDAILTSWGLRDIFAAVEAPSVGSTETKTAGLARLLSGLATRTTNCALIGDTTYDAAAAKENRVPFVGVTWGIGRADELTAAGAVALIDHPRQLITTLSRISP